VVASCGDRLRIWRNDAGRRERFLLVTLRGRPPNTSAYGARVVAEIAGRTLRREVTGGGGYESHGDPRVVLGLGEAEKRVRVLGMRMRRAGPNFSLLAEATLQRRRIRITYHGGSVD